MSKTKIEWAEQVWNPVTGCTKVSAGCKNCYAERYFERFGGGREFSEVQCHPDRLNIPLRRKKPTVYFVNSMSDLFHEDVPDDAIELIFGCMAASEQHKFLVLTKRPDRCVQWISAQNVESLSIDGTDLVSRQEAVGRITKSFFSPDDAIYPEETHLFEFPSPNIWLGVSIEDQSTAEDRLPILVQIPAAHRFVSCEPMLGTIDLSKWIGNLDWVICGGESGPGARPMHPDWARSLRDQCKASGVPFFFKQWGEWKPSDGASMFYKDICLFNKKENGVDPIYMRDLGDERASVWLDHFEHEDVLMYRVGKKRAGHLLDGREYREYPKVQKNPREPANSACRQS